jgi:hypothetical protein
VPCVAEKENFGAGTTCLIAAAAAVKLAPGWWKVAAAAGVLSCLLWIDSARRQLSDCLRAQGRTAEADILDYHGQEIDAEINYLKSLGVSATAAG